jgi:hypothetical protein
MSAFEDASVHTAPESSSSFQVLRPIYLALVREFVLEVPECPFAADCEPENVAEAEDWFRAVDSAIQVHQLRQFVQATTLLNEPVLRSLVLHHLQSPSKTSADRDKLDFLLVQYFSFCAESGLHDIDLDHDYVGRILAPVLGSEHVERPSWIAPVETLVLSAVRCRRLSELLHGGILEQGRRLKAQAGECFFDRAALIAFTRFNCIIRRVFFRLMHDDLNAIQDGLRELDRQGISRIDCRRAQFSSEETTARLRLICQSWKVMFQAEYSSGQPLRMLVDLRAAIDDALADTPTAGEGKKSMPAAAGLL